MWNNWIIQVCSSEVIWYASPEFIKAFGDILEEYNKEYREQHPLTPEEIAERNKVAMEIALKVAGKKESQCQVSS